MKGDVRTYVRKFSKLLAIMMPTAGAVPLIHSDWQP